MEGRKRHVPPEGKQSDGSIIRHITTKLFGKKIVTGYEVVAGNPQDLSQEPPKKTKKRTWNIPGTDIPRPPDTSFIEKSQTTHDKKNN